ncbi:MAG TPA: FAD-binding oxidoreductase [Paracoccus solventivorans]|uniref:FAD-binding oxidoreductase n=1 Tax=Paracoccus solventivorans TaxID=53463 RepID=UPI002C634455|nr:FAD-binding oxidoreductase [Paracoccus solventivorans]HMM09109.1 FAD-binding oxidoreductase [Paracoccus solventivorans]
MTRMPDPADLAWQLAEMLGPRGWIAGEDAAPWQRDWLDRHGAPPLGVARPGSTAEVAAVVGACRAAGVAVVPQGGNTGLCAAAVAAQPGAVILSLARMAGIGPPDPSSAAIEVGAGVVLAALHQALDGTGLMFPLHLGAEGSAQIGGLIGTNAGGSHAFRFGMMGDLLLGVEVVLPDGSIWNGLRAVQKDNAGYQLRRLFAGAEGTLGIVTRAVLRLFPAPRQRATAFLALPDLSAAVALGTRLRAEAGEFLTGLEFFSDLGLGLALEHLPGLSYPLDTRGGAYVLVEVASGSDLVPLDDILEGVLEWGMGQGLVLDGALAASEAQRAGFWRLREEQPEGQRLEGPQLKHDIAVPPGRIAEFVARAAPVCEGLLPGVRINPFGHLGDGNIHYNLSPPHGAGGFAGTEAALGLELARLATAMGGSFAAEHGLGRTKIALADALRPPEERRLMRALKQALDPDGGLNPGVLVQR